MSSLAEVKIDGGMRGGLGGELLPPLGLSYVPKQSGACTSARRLAEGPSSLRRGHQLSGFDSQHHAAAPQLHLLLIFTPRTSTESRAWTGTFGRRLLWTICPVAPVAALGKKHQPNNLTALKIAFPPRVYSTQDASGSKTSIKEGDFHLCVTRICAYHTVREHKAIYSGLLGRCHAARVKCCRVGGQTIADFLCLC